MRTSSVTLEVMTASEEQHGEVDAAAGRISDGTGCEGGVQGPGRCEFTAGPYPLSSRPPGAPPPQPRSGGAGAGGRMYLADMGHCRLVAARWTVTSAAKSWDRLNHL